MPGDKGGPAVAQGRFCRRLSDTARSVRFSPRQRFTAICANTAPPLSATRFQSYRIVGRPRRGDMPAGLISLITDRRHSSLFVFIRLIGGGAKKQSKRRANMRRKI